jgi:hypothetical protein
MLKRFVLSLLVAWAAFAFLHELNRAVTGYDARAETPAHPRRWQPGMAGPVRLERCLAPARRAIDRGAVVAFASPDEPAGSAFFRWRWAAYLMPAHDVIQAGDPAAARLADYAIACGTRLDDPRLAPVRELPGGRLYRVLR